MARNLAPATASDRNIVKNLENFMKTRGAMVSKNSKVYENRDSYVFERRDHADGAVSFFVSRDGLSIYSAKVLFGKPLKILSSKRIPGARSWQSLIVEKKRA